MFARIKRENLVHIGAARHISGCYAMRNKSCPSPSFLFAYVTHNCFQAPFVQGVRLIDLSQDLLSIASMMRAHQ